VYTQNHGIFQKKQQVSVDKHTWTCQFTVPQIKIVYVLSYWMIHSILLWMGFSVRAGREDIFDYHLRSYANCMAGGYRKHHNCHGLRLDLEAEANPVLEVIIYIANAFYNFAILSFVIQFQTIKNSLRHLSCKH